MTLSIVIPAYNEEASIESIIEKTLAAREYITSHSGVTDVNIIVVSDGSTDRTVEKAKQYTKHIHLIVFEKNRGYGAAIKEGWRQADGDLLAFLDADGTCDPKFFADLSSLILDGKADVALGSRLHTDSKMPFVRRLGNTLYALLLSLIALEKVRDTASGMRVIWRTCLPDLMPLPDGLHFTPSMSAKCVLSKRIKIVEKDMTYHEREGRSKLNLFRDGVRFLKVIMKTAMLYRPNRILLLFSLVSVLAAVFVMLRPMAYYVQNHGLLDWMIYRFQLAHLFGIFAMLMLCASYLVGKMVDMTVFYESDASKNESALSRFFNSQWPWLCIVVLLFLGTLVVYESLRERIMTGRTHEHWSRYISMSFFYISAFIMASTKVIDYVLNLIIAREAYLLSDEFSKLQQDIRERGRRGRES